jgi:predicted amidohydrolase
MRVAVIQLEITKERDVNFEKALKYIKKAAQRNTELIVLPEVFNTGFFPENYSLVGDVEEELKPILDFSKTSSMVIIAGIAERAKKLYSSALIIHQGKIMGKHRKTRIFPLTDEIKYFSPGNEIIVYDTPFGKIGLTICYEIRFPEIARKLTFMGAEILVVPAQFPSERIQHWITLLRARAIENQIFVIGANCAKHGKSMIVDPWGNVLAEAGVKEELITAEIDLKKLVEIRKSYPFLNLAQTL